MLSTLLVLALITAGLAAWQRQRASGAQHLAIARGMMAQADRIRDQDPRGALQLGVAARHFNDSSQTQASLLQTITATSHFRTLRGHTDAVFAVAFAPDGHTLATGSADKTVILWELPRNDVGPVRPRGQLPGHLRSGLTNPPIPELDRSAVLGRAGSVPVEFGNPGVPDP